MSNKDLFQENVINIVWRVFAALYNSIVLDKNFVEGS